MLEKYFSRVNNVILYELTFRITPISKKRVTFRAKNSYICVIIKFHFIFHNRDLYEEYLKPYFANAFRPLHQGDTFIVSRGMRAVEFKVTKIDPEPFGFITAETTIHMDGEPIDRDDEDV